MSDISDKDNDTLSAASEKSELEPDLAAEFESLFEKVDEKHHEYLRSVIKNPIMQFQKSSAADYLKLVEEKGLAEAAALAMDSRDYTKGNSWEQAQMNVMNAILPPPKMLKELLHEAVVDGNPLAVKWYAEVSGNPQEIIELLKPVLNYKDQTSRFWAAIHLSKHYQEADDLVPILTEGLSADWIAFKLEHSSTGMTGKGECAKALARLGKNGKSAKDELCKQLQGETIGAADASQIAGALYQMTGEIEPVLTDLSKIAERVLTEKRGTGLHTGDKDMLMSLKNMIKTWREKGESENEALKEKVALLENEINYHFQN